MKTQLARVSVGLLTGGLLATTMVMSSTPAYASTTAVSVVSSAPGFSCGPDRDPSPDRILVSCDIGPGSKYRAVTTCVNGSAMRVYGTWAPYDAGISSYSELNCEHGFHTEGMSFEGAP